ncbi:MAG TPA: 4-hydroxy-3-methylbut-2-en-1-yl diphosphate synthase, partial [Bacteroidaceae bacterium]|nr:4-hydroxy-3-methylbut-2-en-1-yl diphosphate synthase [Bacteroidaceae bacterium]
MKTYASEEVNIGSLRLGGNNSVRVQSMTNTDTNDIKASLAQCEALIEAGAELVRLTTQGRKEVKSAAAIRNCLHKKNLNVPIVADIHFNPLLAEEAAAVVDKIRINPGNYLKKNFDWNDSKEQAYTQLRNLIKVCDKHHTAIRIGVNHGSLSERILMKYGDTPLGMVESAMEFVRICAKLNFHMLVISLKSSNTRVMIQSVRLLTKKLTDENLNYPIHLGVTEAGNDVYGRIKSIVGIASLLLEGMGDTIRVSLTENPVNELPVAKKIVSVFKKPAGLNYNAYTGLAWDPFSYRRRLSLPVAGIGNGKWPVIISNYPGKSSGDLSPTDVLPYLITSAEWEKQKKKNLPPNTILVVEHTLETIQEIKHLISEFCKINSSNPVLYKRKLPISNLEDFQIILSGELGFLLIDGFIDAVWIENSFLPDAKIYELILMIMQAGGSRISETEYIACPSCGRTHFDIESRLAEIKRATSHLNHLRIGVMGCIVNGPGEMADADYGYVGAGKGMISIYRGREVIYKNIPEGKALETMLALIKECGDWRD